MHLFCILFFSLQESLNLPIIRFRNRCPYLIFTFVYKVYNACFKKETLFSEATILYSVSIYKSLNFRITL